HDHRMIPHADVPLAVNCSAGGDQADAVRAARCRAPAGPPGRERVHTAGGFREPLLAQPAGADCFAHGGHDLVDDLWAGGSAAATGTSTWESVAVSPCPGKCLAQAATPALCRPRTQAAVWPATSSGLEPNDRTPTTGFRASALTSATGARSRSTPTCARSAP